MNNIHPTAVIGANVVLGQNVFIGPYCVIGTPAEHPRESVANRGKVIIGDNVRLYKLVTVDSPLYDEGTTEIGDGCTLMAHAHLGHDVKLGKKVTISTGAKIGGHSVIGEHCTIGLNAVTHQRTEIPKGCILGAGSFLKGVWKDEFRKLVGSPAKDIGPNEWLLAAL